MPTPDKLRPFVDRKCGDLDCEFHSTQEWAWFRHEAETGHTMQPMPLPVPVRPAMVDTLGPHYDPHRRGTR